MINITYEREHWEEYTVSYNHDDGMWYVCNGNGSLWQGYKTEDEANREAGKCELQSFICEKIFNKISNRIAQCITECLDEASCDLVDFMIKQYQENK